MNPSKHDQSGHGHGGSAKLDNGVKDPVCGMTVDPHTRPIGTSTRAVLTTFALPAA